MHAVCDISQKINNTEFLENKLINMKIAISHIANRPIPPGGIFSFWHLVGEPSVKRGFRPGRNILDGSIKSATGGGLCQLAGIIYHLALICGMKIIERHSHTMDIYSDEERYTPLGTDAAIAYGYKDLRFQNTQAGPLSLNFSLQEDNITASMLSSEKFEIYHLEIRNYSENGSVFTEVKRKKDIGTAWELAGLSEYKKYVHES